MSWDLRRPKRARALQAVRILHTHNEEERCRSSSPRRHALCDGRSFINASRGRSPGSTASSPSAWVSACRCISTGPIELERAVGVSERNLRLSFHQDFGGLLAGSVLVKFPPRLQSETVVGRAAAQLGSQSIIEPRGSKVARVVALRFARATASGIHRCEFAAHRT